MSQLIVEGGYAQSYVKKSGERKYVIVSEVFDDIKAGLPGLDMGDVTIAVAPIIRNTVGWHMVNKYAEIFNGIHYRSFRSSGNNHSGGSYVK